MARLLFTSQIIRRPNSVNPQIANLWNPAGEIIVAGKTLQDFLRENKISLPVDILKIDIEGAEIETLSNLPDHILDGFGQMAIEFHDFLIEDINYYPKMVELIRKIGKYYHVIKISSEDWREALFINKRINRLTAGQVFRIKIVHPFLRSLRSAHSYLHRIFKQSS